MKFTGERFIPNQTDRLLEAEHISRYQFVKPLAEGKTVLDCASGEGYGSYLLSENATMVYGVDIDSEAISLAQKKYVRPTLHFKQGSAMDLPLPDASCDLVVSFETIEHVDEGNQHRFLEEVMRILKPEGILILSTPDKRRYSDEANYHNPYHVKEFYESEFKDFLEEFFPYVHFYYQKSEVSTLIANTETRQLSVNEDHPEILSYGTYIIGICSSHPLPSVPGYLMDNGIRYHSTVSRVIQLQAEVEERNQHLSKLDSEIELLQADLKRTHSALMEQTYLVEVRQKEFQRESDEHEKLRKDYDQLQIVLEQCQGEIERLQTLQIQLINQEAHIQLLLKQERILQNIYRSSGWKLLSGYYRLRDSVFPPQKKRTLFAKLAFSFMKNPRKFRGKLTKGNVKKFKTYMKSDKPEHVLHRVDSYLDRHQNEGSSELRLVEQSEEYETLTMPVFDNPKVSIVIPVYNQFDFTYRCLKSILLHTDNIAYEVIVADDRSTDKTIEISQLVKNIKIVRDDVNRGFLLNCNHAAQEAIGEYIYFLNNDTNVQPGWCDSLVKLFEEDPSVGMAGSKLIFADGRLQEAGGIIWKDASGWNYGRLSDPEDPEYNYVKEVDYISGAAIMIRRSLWEEIGGFDERYVPAYYEDSDLAFEVRKHQYKVVYQPQSAVVHFEGISHGTDTGSGIKSYQLKNLEKFREKWKSELEYGHFPNAEHVFWARDRSRRKKTIVVVDHYVPHFDKDAGGRSVFQYLRLFVSLGYHVIFIGDNFFRHEPYTSVLQQLGIEVLYGNWYAAHLETWMRQNGNYIDYVYLNRPHISVKYIDLFRKYSQAKIIYFGHDLHYLRELRNYEIDKKDELLKSSERWKKIEFGLFQKADIVYVVGSYEKQVLEEEFPSKVIRNIPLYLYEPHEIVQSTVLNDREGLLFVGGFGHKPNVDGIIWFVRKVFPRIQHKIPGISLTIIGSNPPSEVLEMNSHTIRVRGFVSDEKLREAYNHALCVVVPLRFGAGVKGKVVEAMAHAVPLVTTNIGAEGLDGIDAIVEVADDPDSFADKIHETVNNSKRWMQVSQNSARYILNNFSISQAEAMIRSDFSKEED
ncbi:glycosyltransferase [Gorillibacterium sp. sgz500922]|uniref:glycosyltransferase n=1 Tax=Gorillibacterium sp. sgz500922 TaxID=3446694 RepID=UPI003F666FB8